MLCTLSALFEGYAGRVKTKIENKFRNVVKVISYNSVKHLINDWRSDGPLHRFGQWQRRRCTIIYALAVAWAGHAPNCTTAHAHSVCLGWNSYRCALPFKWLNGVYYVKQISVSLKNCAKQRQRRRCWYMLPSLTHTAHTPRMENAQRDLVLVTELLCRL